jgi:hypothetical protein
MGGIVKERKGVPLILHGPADHVHLLVSVPTNESVAELLGVGKANSSRWVHEQFPAQRGFAWQAGYAAFTVSGSRAAAVKECIAGQQERARALGLRRILRSVPGLAMVTRRFRTAHAVGYCLSPFGLDSG